MSNCQGSGNWPGSSCCLLMSHLSHYLPPNAIDSGIERCFPNENSGPQFKHSCQIYSIGYGDQSENRRKAGCRDGKQSKASQGWSRYSNAETVRPEERPSRVGEGEIKPRTSCGRTTDPWRGALSETEGIHAAFRLQLLLLFAQN